MPRSAFQCVTHLRTICLGWSQEQVGEALGVAASLVSKLERDIHPVRPRHLAYYRRLLLRAPPDKRADFSDVLKELEAAVSDAALAALEGRQTAVQEARAKANALKRSRRASRAAAASAPPCPPAASTPVPAPAVVVAAPTAPPAVAVVVPLVAPTAATPAAPPPVATPAAALPPAPTAALPPVSAPAAVATSAPTLLFNAASITALAQQLRAALPDPAQSAAPSTPAPAPSAPSRLRRLPAAGSLLGLCLLAFVGALSAWHRAPAPADDSVGFVEPPESMEEQPKFAAATPTAAMGQRQARQIPARPFRYQKDRDCSGPHKLFLNGGCWYGGTAAPCGPDEFVHENQCYIPMAADPKLPVAVESTDAGTR